MASIDVPTRLIQGDADRILPITATGLRTAKSSKGRVSGREGRSTLHHVAARDRVKRRLVSFFGRDGGQVGKAGCLGNRP